MMSEYLYTPEGWLDFDYIYDQPAWLIVLIGKRQVGKTYGNCEKCQTTVTTHTPYDPIEIARQYAPKFDKPAVDMVEVVRCKDCKYNYANMIPGGKGCQQNVYIEVDDNFFCADGERKDEVEE